VEIAERLGEEIASPAYEVAFDPETIEASIAGCDVVIGQRLHSVILAFAYGVPALSLSYQPKCLDFLESVGFADLSLKTDDVIAGRLVEWVDDFDTRWADTSRKMLEAVRGFQAVQKTFGQGALAAMATRLQAP
jgi:polysaccharide pyruvyl transferase WcaK-like protein